MTDERERIDWAAIAEPVTFALLGEPNRKLTRGKDWRYGTKGSLSVDVGAGVFTDFEAGVDGGLLALVRHVRGTDTAEAFRWLEANGFVTPSRRSSMRQGTAAPSPEPEPRRDEGADRDRAAKVEAARRVWAACVPVDGSPIRPYLSARKAWPPIGSWPFPGVVAWITRDGLKSADKALDAGCPAAAVGAMVFAYRPAGEGGEVCGVSVEALDAHGERTGEGGRWRKSRGSLAGAVASLPGAPDGRVLALVEGEADGLAVAYMAARGVGFGDVGEVRVVGGTSGMAPAKAVDADRREVLVFADGPGADGRASGAAAACKLQAALWIERRAVRVVRRDEGDVADDLALLVTRRLQAFDGDEAAAWAVEGGTNG